MRQNRHWGRRLAALPNQQDLLCPIIRGQTIRKACPPQPKHLATAGQQRHQRPFSHRNFCLIQIFFERFANVTSRRAERIAGLAGPHKNILIYFSIICTIGVVFFQK